MRTTNQDGEDNLPAKRRELVDSASPNGLPGEW